MRVLLIDDDADIHALARMIDADNHIDIADKESDALKFLEKNKYDLVVIDGLLTTGNSGLTIGKRIKTLFDPVKINFWSAMGDGSHTKEMQKIAESTGGAFIRKQDLGEQLQGFLK